MVHPMIMASKSDQNSAVNWTPLLASSSLLLSRRPHTEISARSLTSISWPKISSSLLSSFSLLTSDAAPLNTKYWNSSKKKKLSEKNQSIIESLSHSKTVQRAAAVSHLPFNHAPSRTTKKTSLRQQLFEAPLNVGNSRSKEFNRFHHTEENQRAQVKNEKWEKSASPAAATTIDEIFILLYDGYDGRLAGCPSWKL